MTRTPRLTSDGAACCWIPLFALRCETARRPELASLPVALLSPDDSRRVWQGAPLARSAFPLPRSAFRVGWGIGKFVSWVAAMRARPGEAVIVQPGDQGRFLASQPLAVLPLDPDTHRRLLQLGVKTLGALVALPEEAVVSQFGSVGRRLWRLAPGLLAGARGGRIVPEPIRAAPPVFTPVRRGGLPLPRT